MRHALCALVALGLATSAARAHAGVVFDDRDGDGSQDPDEPGRAGVRVVVGDAATVTDASGQFSLAAAPGTIVWARTPADARSVPSWTVVPVSGEPRLALTPAPPTGPLTFAVAADSHHDLMPDDGWDDAALDRALAQVAAAAPGARFLALLGDLSQSAFADELAEVASQARAAGLPLVPVPGNHDWYDLGVAYAAHFGPDQYSLDVPGARVLVWNGNLDDAAIEAFVARELADAPMVPVIALGHQSPSDELAAAMARLGVDALLTGHWHAARELRRGPTLREWGLPPLTMGGVDGSAAGFGIAALGATGLTLRREATTVEPTLAVASGCVRGEVIIDARAVGAMPSVTGRLDCGPPVHATRLRGGAFALRLPPGVRAGPHRLELRRDDDPATAAIVRVDVCGDEPGWSLDLGGPLAAAPARAGELVVVGTGSPGEAGAQLVAVELPTGAVRWRRPVAAVVRGTAAIGADLAVVLRDDGVVEAVALADGAPRWTYALTDGLARNAASAWAAPTIAGDQVLVAVQGRVVALALATGVPRFVLEAPVAYPWLGSRAAIAVHGDVAVVVRNRSAGLWAIDARTGASRWLVDGPGTIAIDGTPTFATVAGEDRVITIDAAGAVVARDLATGAPRWQVAVVGGGFEWGYVAPAPALVDGDHVVVGTRWGDLVALRLADGAEVYRVTSTAPAPTNTAPYRPRTFGFPGGAVRAGDDLMAIDAAGTLHQLDPTSGATRGRWPLGAEVRDAPLRTPVGLVVATVDGVLRLLPPAAPPPDLAPPACRASAARTAWPWLVLGAAALLGLAVTGLTVAQRARRRGARH